VLPCSIGGSGNCLRSALSRLSRLFALFGRTLQMDADNKSTFPEHRQYLFSLAYRMTGSAAIERGRINQAAHPA
jgi:hypothetical protein